MNPYINSSILQARLFQSDSLGVLTTIYHLIESEGDYLMTIFLANREVGQLSFQCSEACPETQLDLDLFSLGKNSFITKEKLVLKKGGYLVLFVSEGSGGYHIALIKKDPKPKTIYNSQKLVVGDFFSVPLVQPGRYEATLKGIPSSCKLLVTSPSLSDKTFVEPAPITVEVTEKGFSQKDVALICTQGLIFSLKASATIILRMIESSEKDHPTGRKISWLAENKEKSDQKKKSKGK